MSFYDGPNSSAKFRHAGPLHAAPLSIPVPFRANTKGLLVVSKPPPFPNSFAERDAVYRVGRSAEGTDAPAARARVVENVAERHAPVAQVDRAWDF